MPLVILGIIVLIAVLLLVKGGVGFLRQNIDATWSNPSGSDRLRPRKQYKKSADGKVVYLFDDEKQGDRNPSKDKDT